MQKKQILIDQKILSYYQGGGTGKESVLVFLHGWMQNWKSFEKIFKLLEEKKIPYISLDLPGFWTSQLLHDDMTIEEYWDVVIKTIKKLWLESPILLGHSFGGRICIYLGSFYANIQKIILVCAAGIAYKIPLHKYIVIKTGKIILALPGLKSIGSKIKEWFSSPDLKNAGTMTKIFRNTIALDLQDKMKLIDYPTLMIWWDSDDQTPVSEGEVIHWHIKNSEFHILKWSHFVHQEKVEEITSMILTFIKK